MKNDPRIASFTQFTKRELGEFTQLSQKSEKKIRTSTGFEPATWRYRCDELTHRMSYEATDVGSWSVMCSYVAVREMNVIVVYEINRIRTVEMKSYEEWSS